MSGAAPLRRGDLVAGKYTVDEVIGSGGMGYVVLATHPILGACAIKLLHPDRAQDPEIVARFVREAQAARQIQNEHVVRVSDVGIDPASGAPFIVMERLQGQDLAHVLQAQGRLSVEQAVEYLLQACEALAEAHIEGIVHRDLKPANLFVTTRRDGSPFVKVLDFGISKMTAPEGSGPGGVSGLTRTTGVLGTVLYMSPEQLQWPKEVDARSDIWALGVILYELLSGTVPFLGEDMPNICVKVILQEPVPLGTLRPDVPAQLLAVVARCLRKDRDERFPHVSDFAHALFDVATARGRGSIERIVDVGRAAGQALALAPLPPSAAAGAGPTSPGNASATHLAAGTTTSGAVRTSATEPSSGTGKRSRAPLLLGGFAVAALLGGIAAFAFARDGSEASTPPASIGVEASERPRKREASSPSPSSAREVPSTEASASASASAPGAAAASTKPAAPPSTGKPTAVASRPTAVATSLVTSPPPAANCDPPYVYDAKGMKRYKPGCE